MKLQRNDGSIEVQFTMRLENSFYEKIKAVAIKDKRSIAKQIEFMLEQQLEK